MKSLPAFVLYEKVEGKLRGCTWLYVNSKSHVSERLNQSNIQ